MTVSPATPRSFIAAVRHSIVLCGAVTGSAGAQQPVQPSQIPIWNLAPSAASSRETVGSISGLKQLPDGRVLVHDYSRRRLIVFDASLAAYTVSADSAGTSGKIYPRVSAGRLVPYLADSMLLVDWDAKAFLVITPDGVLGRTMATVKPNDLQGIGYAVGVGVPGSDAQGRIVYRAALEWAADFRRLTAAPVARATPPPPPTRDTIAIVRADFEKRIVDTIASFSLPRSPAANRAVTDKPKVFVNPVPSALDEWAVLSDGSVAVVRGHDYHIDWVYPDGGHASTPKMPFDWRRLTDDDKQRKLDSARRIIDSMSARGEHYGMYTGTRSLPDGKPILDTIFPIIEYVPLRDMADYVAPVRAGALKPDLDGNLWILPTTTAQVGSGLLYDVVNRAGIILERVRVPAGRDIVGFGRGGVVYLGRPDGSNGYYLERTIVSRVPPAKR